MIICKSVLMEQSDITGILKDMDFEVDDVGELIVANPPMFHAEPEKSKVLVPDA